MQERVEDVVHDDGGNGISSYMMNGRYDFGCSWLGLVRFSREGHARRDSLAL